MSMKRVLGAAAVLVLVLAGVGGGFALGRSMKPAAAPAAEKPEAPEAHPRVRVAKIRREVLQRRLVCFGVAQAQPANERILTARAAGVVSEVAHRKGDRVTRGEVLVTLDARPLVAARKKTEGALAEAEAELAKANSGVLESEIASLEVALAQARADAIQSARVLVRQRDLAEQGLISLRALQEAEATAEVTSLRACAAVLQLEKSRHGVQREERLRLEARRDQARADVDLARLQESFSVLRADIDATIAELDAVPGQAVDASNQLVRLVQPGAVDAVLYLAAENASRVALGAEVRLLAGTTELGRAKVEGMASAVSADGYRLLRASILDAPSPIAPGTPLTAQISLESVEALAVPRAAVVQDQDRTVILCLVREPDRDESKGPIEVVKKVPVRVLVRDGERVGIEAELPAQYYGVVVEGGYNLPDGTEVEVEQADER
ncbi:HlyD family efflux transporter periplasmic adaptor subunit [bacterium]|nr:HlyD family efflux transporter periplasmic adaptor subunit [bacterium]